MLSARQLLLMRRARDRAIGIAIAPIGTVVLFPDPDFRRRVLRYVIHVGPSVSLDGLAEWIEWIANDAQCLGLTLNARLGFKSERLRLSPRCPIYPSRAYTHKSPC